MNKFGCKDGYDLEIYVNGMTYELDSVRAMTIETRADDRIHIVRISDSLINVDFVNAVYEGLLLDSDSEIMAKGTFRGVDGLDYKANISIRNAVFSKFNLPKEQNVVVNPILEFEVDFFDDYDNTNIAITVLPREE